METGIPESKAARSPRLTRNSRLCAVCRVSFTADRAGELQRALELGKYKGELTEKWREEEPSKILALSEAEESLLMDYYYYTNGYTRWDSEGNELPPAFSSQEKADNSIAHMKYLLSLKEDKSMFSETLWMYIDALHEVEADAEYIAGYDEYLQKIQKQTEEQSKTSIFGKKNSFSMRNLRKTAKEFGKLLGKADGKAVEEVNPETAGGKSPGTGKGEEGQGSVNRSGAVQVSFGNNTGIEKWLQFTLGRIKLPHKNSQEVRTMSDNILQLNTEFVHNELKDLVRNSVEETLNAMLDAEADRLVNADRYARSEEREGYRASHYDRSFTTTSGEVNLRISARALHIILLTIPLRRV